MIRRRLIWALGVVLAFPAVAATLDDVAVPHHGFGPPISPMAYPVVAGPATHGDEGGAPERVLSPADSVERPGDPRSSTFARAVHAYAGGDFAAAVSDFEAARRIAPDDHYRIAWEYLARLRHGEDANPTLVEHTAGLDLDSWPGPLLAWYLGRGTLGHVVDAARDVDLDRQIVKTCEAGFFVGQKLLSDGLLEDAHRWFATSVATCDPSSALHLQARALLDPPLEHAGAATTVADVAAQERRMHDSAASRTAVDPGDASDRSGPESLSPSVGGAEQGVVAELHGTLSDDGVLGSAPPVVGTPEELLTGDPGTVTTNIMLSPLPARLVPPGLSEEDVEHVSADPSRVVSTDSRIGGDGHSGAPIEPVSPAIERALAPSVALPVNVSAAIPVASDDAPVPAPETQTGVSDRVLVVEETVRPGVAPDADSDAAPVLEVSPDTPRGEAQIATTGVNLRSGPGLHHAKVGFLEGNAVVDVEASVGEWKQVRLPGGDVAFAHGDFLEPADIPTAGHVVPLQPRGYVATTRVNYRAGPGTRYARVGVAQPGDKVIIDGEVGDWFRVHALDTRTVFLHKDYLQASSAPPSRGSLSIATTRREAVAADVQ